MKKYVYKKPNTIKNQQDVNLIKKDFSNIFISKIIKRLKKIQNDIPCFQMTLNTTLDLFEKLEGIFLDYNKYDITDNLIMKQINRVILKNIDMSDVYDYDDDDEINQDSDSDVYIY